MKKLVIIGAGFGGLTVFHHVSSWMDSQDVEVTVIAPRLYGAIENFEQGNILIGSAPMLSGTRLKDVPHLYLYIRNNRVP